MKHQRLVILGSTGSIGEQALDILREHPETFTVEALSCNSNWKTFADQINEFKPRYALLCDEKFRPELEEAVDHRQTELIFGSEKLTDLAVLEEAGTVLNALVGFAGFEPTYRALRAGKKVALANKESLVAGGPLLHPLLKANPNLLIPVDSEHSAMLQCLVGESPGDIEKIVITASGGPFRTWSHDEMNNITVEDALNHPNWSMGAKITVDSATMMNKGLEIIETRWMFDISPEKIEAVVHPQSIIHSIITFVDGSSKAQLGPPDMKVPILYALTYPERLPMQVVPRMDWQAVFDLNFEPVDEEKFPCLRLAKEALKQGGNAPAVLNASNEVAVERFLNKEIAYIEIPSVIERCLNSIDDETEPSVETLKEIDQNTRTLARTI